jgi:hypothetical protein
MLNKRQIGGRPKWHLLKQKISIIPAKDQGHTLEAISLDSGLAENCSCIFCTSAIHGGHAGMTKIINSLIP